MAYTIDSKSIAERRVGSTPTFGIMNDNNDIFVGDDDHAKIPEPLDYRLRAATKRNDLPDDVIRLLADAYYEVWLGTERVRVLQDMHENLLVTKEKLEQERDEARRIASQQAMNRIAELDEEMGL